MASWTHRIRDGGCIGCVPQNCRAERSLVDEFIVALGYILQGAESYFIGKEASRWLFMRLSTNQQSVVREQADIQEMGSAHVITRVSL